ncbi:MAG: VOC family protein [Candidatus Saccharimonadales bacterium]
MTEETLTNSLLINPSQLYVRDLAKMSQFYRDQVGLEALETTNDRILLGHDHTAVIELVEKTKLTFANPHSAGLFHNAILFSARGNLSRTVGDLITQSPQLFTGTGDHLVSEAFYFNDPEGNGLELYFDRPSDTWQWNDGQVVMDTLYIDPIGYINQHASEKSAADKKLGHVHLRIGDINQARDFYISLLGFNVTADIGSALFISIAGYHHHIGLNTWFSQGAGKRTPTLGLSDVTITLEDTTDVTNLAARLENASYPFVFSKGKVLVSDPWGNSLVFTAK